jgi:hypothetical protein
MMKKFNIVFVIMLILLCACSNTQETLFRVFPIVKTDYIGISEVVFDKSDNMYVVDALKGQIVKLDQNGRILSTFGNGGQGNAQFTQIFDIAIDDAGYLYAVDKDGRIVIMDPKGNVIQSWTVVGPKEVVLFNIGVDSKKNIFVTDQLNNRILKYDKLGNLLLELKGSGANYMENPAALAIGPDDSLYTSSELCWGLLNLDQNGTLLRNDIKSRPHSIAIAANGTIYTTSPYVVVYDKKLKVIYAWDIDDQNIFPKQDTIEAIYIHSISVNNQGKIFVVRGHNEILVCDKYVKNFGWIIYVVIGIVVVGGATAWIVFRNKKKRQSTATNTK